MGVRLFPLANPYRVVFDLPEVGWRLPPKPLPVASGVYERLRYGLYKPGSSRVVLDLSGPARIANATLIDANGAYGHRLVVELKASTQAAFLENLKNDDFLISSSMKNNPGVLARLISPPAPSARKRKTEAKPEQNRSMGHVPMSSVCFDFALVSTLVQLWS